MHLLGKMIIFENELCSKFRRTTFSAMMSYSQHYYSQNYSGIIGTALSQWTPTAFFAFYQYNYV